MEIQQAAWGAQRPTGYLKRSPQHSRPHKNVAWWRDGAGGRMPNYESNFTRALYSLERREVA